MLEPELDYLSLELRVLIQTFTTQAWSKQSSVSSVQWWMTKNIGNLKAPWAHRALSLWNNSVSQTEWLIHALLPSLQLIACSVPIPITVVQRVIHSHHHVLLLNPQALSQRWLVHWVWQRSSRWTFRNQILTPILKVLFLGKLNCQIQFHLVLPHSVQVCSPQFRWTLNHAGKKALCLSCPILLNVSSSNRFQLSSHPALLRCSLVLTSALVLMMAPNIQVMSRTSLTFLETFQKVVSMEKAMPRLSVSRWSFSSCLNSSELPSPTMKRALD